MPDTSDTSATRMRQVCDTNDMSETRTTPIEYNTSARRVLLERHMCYTNDTSATRVKIHFHIPVLVIWQMKDYKEQFHSKNYLSEMPCSHVKMRLKSVPQKQNFVMAKAISKRYALDCSCKYPCTFPHNYT